jgi:signal transduction histidine kinase
VPEQPDERIAVLLVEDDDEDYLLTRDLFAKLDVHYDIHRVADYRSALEAASEGAFGVGLVDYRLGPDNGIDLVREIVERGDDLPMIVLTGQGDHAVDVEAAKAGAADYLVKGELSPTLLERTIRYAIRSQANLRALREREEGLRRAQRLEAVGQLAGGVAHDFNNMMTAVIGFAELVLAQVDPAQQTTREYLGEIKRAGERAGELSNQLLAFSRMQVLQTSVFDLNTLVAELTGMLNRLISDDIELVSILDPGLASVEADPAQVEQVVVNLAVNASHAMPGGGKLTIETTNVELDESHASRYLDVRPGPYVQLAVSDTGTGMDAETVSRIFEPFFTTKEVGEGTGLGLATVFGIVKQSGGDIGVYSELGRGTTFKVYLPQTLSAAKELDLPVVHSPTALGSETILLVDDEEQVRHFERAVLTASGYTVLEARDPEHALELSRTHDGEIDLLVTDVVMPGLSGRDLAERIVRERPQLKTLYTSGYASGAIAHHGILEPGVAFIQKPLNRLSLITKVRETLDTPTGVVVSSR